MPPRTTLRFASAIAAAAARPKTSSSRTSSPSSSELSSPPDTSPEPETSIYFRKQARKSSKKAQKEIASEPAPVIKPENEPAPSLGDIPSLLDSASLPPPPPTRTRAKRPKKEDGSLKSPSDTSRSPPNWEEMYDLVLQNRRSIPAPVDTMGCASLHDPNAPEIDQRFHTLVSLMLSSQTKDTITAPTVRNLQTTLPGGLTVASILATPPQILNNLISKVGFHKRKTEYILATAKILREEYNGDIPDTLEGLMKLPGVGPKMAHLCMTAAWGKTMGIGVDVHVHRICNLWGWVKNTKTPEDTRIQLEKWLPREKWAEINWLLVGFGQTVCLPRGRKCGECPLSNGLCRAAFKGDVAKDQRALGKKRAKKEESDKSDGEMKDESGEEYIPERKTRARKHIKGTFKEESSSEEEKVMRKRPRRSVKVEVKDKDDWREHAIGDIEDIPKGI